MGQIIGEHGTERAERLKCLKTANLAMGSGIKKPSVAEK